MKRTLHRTLAFTFSFLLFTFHLHSQWVSIPDTNFGTWLSTNYPGCMQGDNQVGWQMDTTCPAIVNETLVNCYQQNLTDITGIEYFDNLQTLNCYSNWLTFLPALPGGLIDLTCSGNPIGSIPLQPSILYLGCGACQLSSMPSLPPNLVSLDCSQNLLTSLPALPSTLESLDCENNSGITSLPTLPASLTELWCNDCQITVLPALPPNLRYMNCSNNQLTQLPVLPDSLVNLDCYVNQLTSLPALPDNMIGIDCDNNQITSIPTLPGNLYSLQLQNNQVTSIPALPASLWFLDCQGNQINSLPPLPNSLSRLWCTNNFITTLPALPDTLDQLACGGNLLTILPALPRNLTELACRGNQLTSIPELPESLGYCDLSHNPLTCLPRLKEITTLDFTYTQVTCVPNYGTVSSSTPLLNSLPLCDMFNTNGCNFYWNISGKAYDDNNNDCALSTGEVVLRNIKLQLKSGGSVIQEMITGGEGLYSFDTDNFGTYTVTVDTSNLPFYVFCPGSSELYDTISPIDSLDYDKDFALNCKPGVDLAAYNVYGWRFRPAGLTGISINAGDVAQFYGGQCDGGVNGNVTVTINGPVSYYSPAAGALTPAVSGNQLTYTVADFGSVNFDGDFDFIIRVDTNAVPGSQVCFSVTVNPGIADINPANNSITHCFAVRNSYDPNEKQVYPEGDIDESIDGWLTYTINFQNTGTDTAQHIYITDTLDSNVDASTFQLLAYSHQPIVQIRESAVRFNFPNINLVDSGTNEPLSHGYVQYKVKIKDNTPVGTEINNTAFIYFDFNAPVVTNTTTNTITTVTVLTPALSEGEGVMQIHPNPANSSVVISVDESMVGSVVAVSDVTGRKMASVQLKTSNTILQTENFSSGVYFVRVSNGSYSVTKKLIVNK